MSQYFSMLRCLDIMHLPPNTPELRNCKCDPWGKLLRITPATTIKIPQQANGREACLSNRFDTLFNKASVNIWQCLRDRCTYEELKSLCVVESKALHECFPDFSFCCEVLLFWKASHPEMQKIQIIRFFFKNRLLWLFEVRLLLFTVRTCVWTLRSRLILSSRSHNTVLYLIRWSIEFSTKLPEGLSRYGHLAIRITSVRVSGILLHPLKFKCSWIGLSYIWGSFTGENKMAVSGLWCSGGQVEVYRLLTFWCIYFRVYAKLFMLMINAENSLKRRHTRKAIPPHIS